MTTIEKVKEVVKKDKRFFIENHKCGVCGVPVGWEVSPNNDSVYFNSNCNCSSFSTDLRQSSYEDIVRHINMQSPECQKENYKEFYIEEEVSENEI